MGCCCSSDAAEKKQSPPVGAPDDDAVVPSRMGAEQRRPLLAGSGSSSSTPSPPGSGAVAYGTSQSAARYVEPSRHSHSEPRAPAQLLAQQRSSAPLQPPKPIPAAPASPRSLGGFEISVPPPPPPPKRDGEVSVPPPPAHGHHRSGGGSKEAHGDEEGLHSSKKDEEGQQSPHRHHHKHHHHKHKKRSGAMLGESRRSDWQKVGKHHVSKLKQQRRMLMSRLKDCAFLHHLPEEELTALISVMDALPVTEGQTIVQQGAEGASQFYVIENGLFDVSIDGQTVKQLSGAGGGSARLSTTTTLSATPSSSSKPSSPPHPHDPSLDHSHFGELALMYNSPRTATVTAASDGTLWVIQRRDFHNLLADSVIRRHAELVSFLRAVPLFADLTDPQLKTVASALEERRYAAGEVVVAEGDVGEEFFLVKSGAFEASRLTDFAQAEDGTGSELSRYESGQRKQVVQTLAVMQKGTTFGESALHSADSLRTATVTAAAPPPPPAAAAAEGGGGIDSESEEAVDSAAAGGGRLYCLSRRDFETMLGPLREVFESNRILRSLSNVQFLQGLSEREMTAVVHHSSSEWFQAGDCVYSEGDAADRMFIVLSGEAEAKVIQEQPPGVEGEGGGGGGDAAQTVFAFKEGEFFGVECGDAVEAEGDNPLRRTTVTATRRMECWSIRRGIFLKFLSHIPELVSAVGLRKKTTALAVCVSTGGGLGQGAGGAGGADAAATAHGQDAIPVPGMPGGAASSASSSHSGVVDPTLPSLLQRSRSNTAASSSSSSTPAAASVSLANLVVSSVLGCGMFGTVKLCTTKDAGGPVFALKTIPIRAVLGSGGGGSAAEEEGGDEEAEAPNWAQVLREVQCLRECASASGNSSTARRSVAMHGKGHPFICELVKTHRDACYLYQLLEFVPGGELFSRMQLQFDGLDLPSAAFYAAQITSALDHMHGRGWVYRDLKPENVMLDAQGYVRLVDFGLAAKLESDGDQTFTLCGTPEYVAPELLAQTGHGYAVDWWALGVLIFEMLAGETPFAGDTHSETYALIAAHNGRNLSFGGTSGGKFSRDAKDIVNGLLQPRASMRLGSTVGGTVDIYNHPFFKAVDLTALLDKSLKAPWVPDLDQDLATGGVGGADLKYFSPPDNVDVDGGGGGGGGVASVGVLVCPYSPVPVLDPDTEDLLLSQW